MHTRPNGYHLKALMKVTIGTGIDKDARRGRGKVEGVGGIIGRWAHVGCLNKDLVGHPIDYKLLSEQVFRAFWECDEVLQL